MASESSLLKISVFHYTPSSFDALEETPTNMSLIYCLTENYIHTLFFCR